MKAFLVSTVLAAALGASAGCATPSAPPSERAAPAPQPLAVAPRLCVTWKAFSGGAVSAPTCQAGKTPAAMYAVGQGEPAGSYFSSLYAERPAGNQVSDVAQVNAWADLANAILQYLKTEKASAALIEGSTSKVLGDAQAVRGDQAQLAQTLTDTIHKQIEAAKTKIQDKVAAEKRAPLAELQKWRVGLAGATEALTFAQTQIQRLAPEYQSLASRHAAYRATEAQTHQRLLDLASRGSAATLDLLPLVEVDLRAFQQADELTADTLLIDVARFSARLSVAAGEYDLKAAPYAEYFEGLGKAATVPDALTAMAQAIAGIDAYGRTRTLTLKTSSEALRVGLSQREQALHDQQVAATVQPVLAQIRLTEASNEFVAEANEKARLLGAPLPKSTVLKFAFYTDVVDANLANLEFEPVCTQVIAAGLSWMLGGCNLLKDEFNKSRAVLTKAAPAAMKFALSSFTRKGVPAETIAVLQAHLAANRVRDAAYVYDSILRDIDAAAILDGGVVGGDQ